MLDEDEHVSAELLQSKLWFIVFLDVFDLSGLFVGVHFVCAVESNEAFIPFAPSIFAFFSLINRSNSAKPAAAELLPMPYMFTLGFDSTHISYYSEFTIGARGQGSINKSVGPVTFRSQCLT
jgi:hypothetical protein